MVRVESSSRDRRPHPEERACRNRYTRCNARTRVSRDEDSTDVGALMLRDASQRASSAATLALRRAAMLLSTRAEVRNAWPTAQPRAEQDLRGAAPVVGRLGT